MVQVMARFGQGIQNAEMVQARQDLATRHDVGAPGVLNQPRLARKLLTLIGPATLYSSPGREPAGVPGWRPAHAARSGARIAAGMERA